MKYGASSFLCCLIVCAVAPFFGCGNGGEGGTPAAPARLDLRVDPQVIDSGDTANLSIEISELKEEIWDLKIRLPKGLEYIKYSSFYVVGDDTIATTPQHTGTDDNYLYLVYYPTRNIFEPRGQGRLLLKVLAKKNIPDGLIGVDADIYDPNFNPKNPRFDPQDEEHIRVGPKA